jgi:acetyltransferase
MAHDVFEGAGPLHAVFHPASVAVIGASTEPHTLGHKVFSGLQSNSFGFPVYRALDDALAPVDLAVVVTTGDDALDALERCAAAGVNGVVVMSGVDGSPERHRDFERRVGELLHKSRTKLIGPRCFALMNPSVGLNVSPGLPMPVAGNVAFIAQSSSLATTIIDWSHKGIVGFSAFVALGDMLDVGWGNLIDYFGADWATRAICIHMESIVNMRSFCSHRRARRTTAHQALAPRRPQDRQVRFFRPSRRRLRIRQAMPCCSCSCRRRCRIRPGRFTAC